MAKMQKITPCLWFAGEAEEAAKLYTSAFKNSRITKVVRYGEAGREIHRQAPGTVMTVSFELDGHAFTALNGGPLFKFSEAISFQIMCDTQEEIDHFWTTLGEGGDPKAQQCGWLKDRFGLSWQVIPAVLFELVSDPDPAKAQRATTAMLQMKKMDIAALKRAHAG